MSQNNPMFYVTAKIWKAMAVLYQDPSTKWRIYAILVPYCIFHSLQFIHVIGMEIEVTEVILNIVHIAVIFNGIVRTAYTAINRHKFEVFILEADSMYKDIEQSNNEYAVGILKEHTLFIHKLSIFNVALTAFNVFGALTYPWLCGRRIHPVAISVPGVDLIASPTYEIVYALESVVPFLFMSTYAPFLNFFIIFALLCKTGLLYLQRQITEICQDGRTEEEEIFALNKCIIYYNQLYRYTEKFNSLVTHVMFFELVVFSSVICGLLFSIGSTERFIENLCNIVYIWSTLFTLFITYWFANEILTESIKVSEVAYSIPWYNKNKIFCKTLLCFMMRAQKPLQVMVGNLLPMNLATYQRLLNASYTYFNLVWSFYKQ